ncbi:MULTISPECIES: hypothetical protein [Actinomycetes]|uniref:Uncharacterized protein n=2 Tax=Actinomycetes TaxID=1760 RepID=A0ABP6M2E0_9MICC
MTEEMETAAVPTTVRMLGIVGIALLALTGCGAGEAEEDAGEQDAGQEDVDPDGAEDQGDEPDEIAEDGADEEPEDETEAEAGDAPAIEEIEADLWRAMEEAESVVLDAEVPAGAEEVEADIDAEEGADTIVQHYSGQMDGSALTLREEAGGASAEYISFDDGTYLRGEDELAAVARQFPGEIDEDELAGEFEGKWVDYSQIFPEGFTVDEWMADFRGSLEEAGGFGELEAEADTRDGEDVWIYTDDRREIVVRAGDDPVLLSVYADNDGDVFDVRFSDWDEAAEPERPADEDILTVDDMEDILS